MCLRTLTKNTQRSWKCFADCLSERNKVSDENDKCPESILEVQSPEVLNNWLPQFIAKACRSDGEPYTLRSIHQIFSGLLRYMRSINDDCANFMDKIDARFRVMAVSKSHNFTLPDEEIAKTKKEVIFQCFMVVPLTRYRFISIKDLQNNSSLY